MNSPTQSEQSIPRIHLLAVEVGLDPDGLVIVTTVVTVGESFPTVEVAGATVVTAAVDAVSSDVVTEVDFAFVVRNAVYPAARQ
jgi:hypothetical protein